MTATTVADVRLAAIHYEAGFPIDDLLSKLGEALRREAVRLGGAVQLNAPGAASACSAMTLVDLSSGATMDISQDLGSQAQACRLDAGRLAEFGALLDRKFDDDADLLILNKFGKAESEGHGLRRNFARAIEAGIPVLTAVRPPYDDAWRRFHEGLAVALPPDFKAAFDWCASAVAQRRWLSQSVEPV
jgi:hypothetical protein